MRARPPRRARGQAALAVRHEPAVAAEVLAMARPVDERDIGRRRREKGRTV